MQINKIGSYKNVMQLIIIISIYYVDNKLSDQHRFVGFIVTVLLFPEGVNKKVVSKYLAFAFIEGFDFNQRFLFSLWQEKV